MEGPGTSSQVGNKPMRKVRTLLMVKQELGSLLPVRGLDFFLLFFLFSLGGELGFRVMISGLRVFARSWESG